MTAVTAVTAPGTSVDVLVVGSLNADLVVTSARLPGDGETVPGEAYFRTAGGKGLNQAVAAARSGARTAVVGCVGTDDLGTYLLGEASAAGVGLDGVRRTRDVPTGMALIMVDAAGTNRIVVVPGANGTVDAAHVRASAPPACVVLTQLEVPPDAVGAALEHGRRCGALTLLNPAPALDLTGDVLDLCDWLLPNEHEAALLLGRPVSEQVDGVLAAAHALQALGPRAVAITRGAAGAVAVEGDGTEHVLPAFPVRAVDTTAAGDAFCGAFSAAVAGGAPAAQALRRACAAGALATTVPGAVRSLPTLEAVDRLLR